MSTVYLALYKGRKTVRRPRDLADCLIRLATRSPYSHCELAYPAADGRYSCYSSSLRDGGVRCKTMALPADKWDFIPVSHQITPPQLAQRYVRTRGAAYDLMGALGIVLPLEQRADKWFCSEWCAAALGLPEPHRASPQTLVRHLKQKAA